MLCRFDANRECLRWARCVAFSVWDGLLLAWEAVPRLLSRIRADGDGPSARSRLNGGVLRATGSFVVVTPKRNKRV